MYIGNEWKTVAVNEVKSVCGYNWDGTESDRVYKVLENVDTGKCYFGIYDQPVEWDVLQTEEAIYEASQSMPNVIDIYSIKSEGIITEFVKYYPMIITTPCYLYGKDVYIERSQAHYKKFKMDTTEDILGKDNLNHLEIDPNFENNRQELYDKVLQTYIDFHQQTNCFFRDIDPNNILVNDDFTDFKIIDVASLKHGDNIIIDGHQPFPVPVDRIIGPVPSYKYLHSL